MQVIKPYHAIEIPIDEESTYAQLERAGRTAYKSEDRITTASGRKFLASIIQRGHESVLEHFNISIRFVCDRGVTHEIVRHRLCAYTQESTRYCNYARKGMVFILPPWGFSDSDLDFLESVEKKYNRKIVEGQSPQQARAFLPNCLKTEIVCTANIREWRHIMRLRTASSAHPQMQELMKPLLRELRTRLPVLFNDVGTLE
ncbi:hypothetical protein LCGC14_2845440 [marine sediment metagenome]|uniref:Thymidylate synthase (FAD) n=1 Tax=marine sediment metagenome TaxID=412755 RepID=A0A0F9B103_9ZZZZ